MNKKQRDNSLQYKADDPRRRKARGVPISPEMYAEIKARYQRGHGIDRIAEETGYARSKVYRALKRMGVKIRPRGKSHGVRCVECGRPSDGGIRCGVHRRIRNAELNRDAQRIRTHVKNPRVEDSAWSDRQEDESIGVGIRKKQSGIGGPMVMQLETQA